VVQVRWLRRALKDLDEAVEYVARDNREAAAQLVERIVTSVEKLCTHPAAGRPGRVPGTRELIVSGTRYLVPYRVRGETVQILRVFHGARKWPEQF
jgi:toxin ParE1/3/4